MSFINPVVASIKSGLAPLHVRLIAARGDLPLAPEDQLEVTTLLARDNEESVRKAAYQRLGQYTDEELISVLENKELPSTVLEFSAGFFLGRAKIVEKILLHPSTPNTAVAALAPGVPASLAELIIHNQVRIIEHPEILQALRKNPGLTPGNRRRLDEIENDFLKKDAAIPVSTPKEPPQPPAVLMASLGAVREAAQQDSTSPLVIPDEPESESSPEEEALIEEMSEGDDEKFTIYQKISRLPVSGKIKLAMLGRREERAILVRDSNRLVATSVLGSPKLTDGEVESFSQLRNVNDEVLRIIASNKAWVKNYRVTLNLVKNPRTPVHLSMPMVTRLSQNDLKLLAKDRTIPEAIRQHVKRILDSRMT